VVPQPSRVAMFLSLAGQVAGEVRGGGVFGLIMTTSPR